MSKSKRVRISRNGDFTHPDDERVYVVKLNDQVYMATTDAEKASTFTRESAQELIDRGRWAGLDPQMEPVK